MNTDEHGRTRIQISVYLCLSVASPALLPTFRGRARRRDVGADRALVAGGVDGRDTEHPVVDVHLRERVLGHGADRQLVLPVGRPRVAPEDAVAGGAGRGLPAQVRVVAR